MIDLAEYFTTAQGARVLDVPESRFSGSWRQRGIVTPATFKGLMQFSRTDVIRGAVLVCLQRVLGDVSPLAADLAKTLRVDQLEAILTAECPRVTATYNGHALTIDLDPEYFDRVRSRMREVPV